MNQTKNNKQDIILSIALLASDRKDTIEKCLASLTPIREAVSCELIILDTGCSPEIRGLLEKYADKLAEFQWCNDFSKARNATLHMAEGEWFLYLDDDEWFLDTDDLIDFFTSGEYQNYAAASYIQRNYLDRQGSQYTDTRVGRMARRTQELEFRSKIHEYLAPISGANKNLCSKVEHYGYVYDTEEKKLAHFERNRTLLEQMIKDEPDCLRWRLQLLQEYRSIDDYDKMEALGEAGISYIGNSGISDTAEVCVYIGSFYAAGILAAAGKNNYEQVYELCRQAAKDKRNTKMCRAFLNEMLAKACFYQGLYEHQTDAAEAKYRDSEKYAQDYLEACEYFENHKDELYQQQIAPFVGECFDPVKIKEIYSILICCGLKLKRTDNLHQYVDKLHWNEKHVYVFEEIADILIEAMNTADYRIAEDDAAYMVYAKTLAIMYEQGALWKYFCRKIQEYEADGQDMHPLMLLIKNAVPEAVTSEIESSKKESTELRKLAEQIKEQLRLLIESGMTEQAKIVVSQIKTILPDDPELDMIEKELHNLDIKVK